MHYIKQTKFVIAGANDSWIDFIPDDRGRIENLSLLKQGKVIVAHRQ